MEDIKEKIVIFGITGQDGSFLKDLYNDSLVYGFARGIIHSDLFYQKMDLAEVELPKLVETLEDINPSIIYNFAGQSSVGQSFKHPGETFTSNYLSHFNLLEACAILGFKGRIYSALSSEMIGKGSLNLDTGELTCLPVSPYGLSKLACYNLNQIYRKTYGLDIVDGILFNHESARRRSSFLIGKVIDYIRNGKNGELILGDLSVRRNFGHANEYMQRVKSHMHKDDASLCICLTEVDYTLSEIIEFFIELAEIDRDFIKSNEYPARSNELGSINVIGDRSEFSDLSHGKNLIKKILDK